MRPWIVQLIVIFVNHQRALGEGIQITYFFLFTFKENKKYSFCIMTIAPLRILSIIDSIHIADQVKH